MYIIQNNCIIITHSTCHNIYIHLDIIEQVQKRYQNPCRPEIYSDVRDATSIVVKLMQLCWSDDELERPTFGHIRSYIKKNVQGM